jgi:hypothetical protein
MLAWLRNVTVPTCLTWLGVLTGACSLLFLLVVPIIRGKPLSDTADQTALYLMITSAAVCLIANVYELVVDLLRAALRSVHRSR